MAIKITDNFQVNIKNPIDNRFVVGSQSIPGTIGTIYPTPFYAYRDDISSNIGFVYPGLRIWDFNENLPYVWTGTTWSNENLTGASVLGSGTPAFSAGGGYRNYVAKFFNTGTVLTKGLLYDNNDHIGLGLVSGINPNSSGSGPIPQLISSASGLTQGLHVAGRIRTNSGFVGDGNYIHNLNANNINGGPGGTGRLKLEYIISPNESALSGAATYMLISNGVNTTNAWKDVLQVVPQPISIGGGTNLYSGINGTNYEFFSLTSTGLSITDGVSGAGKVRIESLPAVNVGSGSASVYKQLNPTTKLHEFKTITSDFMNITDGVDGIKLDSNITSSSLQVSSTGEHGIKIEIPASFEGTDYYVNNNYPVWQVEPSTTQAGIYNVELGTRSKPFRTLKRCLNKILNRPSSGPVAGGQFGVGNASPDTYDPTINRPNIYDPITKASTQDLNVPGRPFYKWERRTGPGQPKATYLNNYYSNLPGQGAVRVIIQSYTEIDENVAINGVTYFLENGGDGSTITVAGTYQGEGVPRTFTYNDPPIPTINGQNVGYLGSSQNGQPFEYIFDMAELAAGADRGHPIANYWYAPYDAGNVSGFVFRNQPGELDYPVSCKVEGAGKIQYSYSHPTRKGFIKAKGTNSYDWVIDQNIQNPGSQTPIGEEVFGYDQYDCYFYIGSEAGYIGLEMWPLPDNVIGQGTYTHLPTTKTKLVKELPRPVTACVAGLSYQILALGTTTPNATWTSIGASNPPVVGEIFTAITPTSPPTGNGMVMLLTHIIREGTLQYGYKTNAVPDYGAIESSGRNLIFAETLFFAGTVVINCFEQHMVYLKD